MLFPDQIQHKLGFLEIKEEIKKDCISPMGRTMVDKMQFITNFDLLQKLLNQTHEFKAILVSGRNFPSENYFDIRSYTDRIRVEGTYLLEEEFLKLNYALHTVKACLQFIKDSEGLYPAIELLTTDIHVDPLLIKSIEAIIDSKGHIKPNASSELKDIIQSIHSAESDVRKRITQIFKEWQKEGYTSDGQLTVREGRMVIPVSAEYKRKAKGLILDESSTGQTVYMEPTEVFELNNRIRDLEYQKKREIIRILIQLTDEIRPYLPALQQYHSFISIIDFIRAKALFALRLDAHLPIIQKESNFDWINARHPLLTLHFAALKKKVVPLNAKINDQQRIVLISGPNAGGKSVALKTIGLIQLMFQHGLLVPMSPDSTLGMVKKILVDIGDDQSIESDLSTYSAHLSNMNVFLQQATPHTLILIDEFGTGTDPKFGGPMAEAVLELLNQKNIRGVITTHYSNLKFFAGNTPGLVNASMLFDTTELKALYQLEIGQPGSSYAFEIAQKTGLPNKLIQLAKQKVGRSEQKVDDLLIDLQKEKVRIEELNKALIIDKEITDNLLQQNKQLKQELDENRKRLLRDSKDEAKRILQQANKLIENTISEIKEVKADKEKTKLIRKKLEEESEKFLNSAPFGSAQGPTNKTKKIDFKIGDWVRLMESNAEGRILNIQKTKAEVAIGDLRSFVSLSKIEITENKTTNTRRSLSGAEGTSTSYSEAARDMSPQIDVRGMRGDEALLEVEKYLDKALMMGFQKIRILHGKGDGILRKIIRESLKKYKEVASIENEHVDFGGDGISVITLK
ncbi:MAG: endonuclease MutS2 [Sphingobacteriales bacterium]|nr:endonuclease MutS2 [Sphingobacteriales bacterium]